MTFKFYVTIMCIVELFFSDNHHSDIQEETIIPEGLENVDDEDRVESNDDEGEKYVPQL